MQNQDAVRELAPVKRVRVKGVAYHSQSDVYNMEVALHHNYAIQGGVIVHNCESLRYALMSRPARSKLTPKPKPRAYNPLDEPERPSGGYYTA